jgi:hypothetical protein
MSILGNWGPARSIYISDGPAPQTGHSAMPLQATFPVWRRGWLAQGAARRFEK